MPMKCQNWLKGKKNLLFCQKATLFVTNLKNVSKRQRQNTLFGTYETFYVVTILTLILIIPLPSVATSCTNSASALFLYFACIMCYFKPCTISLLSTVIMTAGNEHSWHAELPLGRAVWNFYVILTQKLLGYLPLQSPLELRMK